MNELRDNRYDPKSGTIEGDHMRHTAGIGIHKLLDRVNAGLFGGSREMRPADLPAKVRDAVERAGKLAEQIERCDGLPVDMAVEYLKAQAKIAGEAMPHIEAELRRREREAREAFATMRSTLTGKGNDLVSAGVDVLLQSVNITDAIDREAMLSAWRRAFAICRDTAVAKNTPRWLALLVTAHKSHALQATMT